MPGLRTTLLLWAPKVTQAVIAALGDWYTWRLAKRLYRDDAAASTTAVRNLNLYSRNGPTADSSVALDDGT